MNKLVSKNPVLRFKQGKKIQFVKPGDKMLYHGNEEVTEDVLNGLTIYRRKNGTYIYPSNKFLSPSDYSFMTQGTLNPESVLNKLIRENYFNNQKLKYFNQFSQVENSENPSLLGYKLKRADEILGKLKLLWKLKLKEYVQSGAGVGKVNGKPKTNTNNPSNKELSLQLKTNVPQAQETPQTKQVLSAPTIGFKLAFRQARLAGLKEFTWNGRRFNTKTKEDVLKEKVKFIPPSITEDGGPVYNRSNDIPYMILKQGGQLISRNSIERFKRNFRKVAQ